MPAEGHGRNYRRNEELVIDGVLTTQPELGPSVPDGGYGWVVFLSTLFFQALIPSLIVSFGMFLAFSRLTKITSEDVNPKLWDNKLMYVPLCFIAMWTIIDPFTRVLISNSTWPRLVATAGTCLTCAGLLFLWMGMTGYGGETALFVLAGLVSGIGASIQISQCEILLAQYFRLKHNILAHVTQAVTAIGFILVPITVGHHVLNSSLLNVILWYQAVILQGLVLNLTFRKPMYLKSKQQMRYNYISSNVEDEEDIFSKNTRELQIKRQNSSGTTTTIEKHVIPTSGAINNEAGPSRVLAENGSDKKNNTNKNWETFEDETESEHESNKDIKYDSLKQDWETFDEEEEIEKITSTNKKTVDTVKDKENQNNIKYKNLKLELSFAEEGSKTFNNGPKTDIAGLPLPLFSDLPVNNNNTYSYDILEQQPDSSFDRPAVFMPTTIERRSLVSNIEYLRQPTFYKSLLMVITTKFSIFVYFTLFPSYLYQELEGIKMRSVSTLVGVLSISSFLFSGLSYWVNIDKKRRPICMWFLCWVGSFGYFMVSDSNTEYVLLFGAVQITLSISTLQYVGMPLLGLTLRGETSKEFGLISLMSGSAFLFFLIINASFRDCFRLMSLLHFFMGGIWFANFCYKKLEK